jgi:hypothetical protein
MALWHVYLHGRQASSTACMRYSVLLNLIKLPIEPHSCAKEPPAATDEADMEERMCAACMESDP